ncbi:MAG TPA: hypothetical protein VHN98_05620 [Acidimicrobiales bacterium]|nr:hypothetical protein [Acidimicrobiales bacterium]
MGRGARVRDRDELAEVAGRKKGATADAGASMHDHLLSLQRDYGNTAVTTMVQRKGHPRAASTDAPGAKKSKPAPAKEEDYFPKEHSQRFGSWSDDEIEGHINDWTKPDDKGHYSPNGLDAAAEGAEELWFRHQNRAYAMGVWRVYKLTSDSKRTAFWLGVFQGTIKPHSADAAESQAGKEF